MSELNFGAIANALETQSGYDGDAPPGRATHTPRWLVDQDFDAAMAAMHPDMEPAAELLPRRWRMTFIVGLALLAWVPVAIAGVWLWN